MSNSQMKLNEAISSQSPSDDPSINLNSESADDQLNEVSDEGFITDCTKPTTSVPQMNQLHQNQDLHADQSSTIEIVLADTPSEATKSAGLTIKSLQNSSEPATELRTDEDKKFLNLCEKHRNTAKQWPETYFPVFVLLTVITTFMFSNSSTSDTWLAITSFFVMSAYCAAFFIIICLLASKNKHMSRWIPRLADAATAMLFLALISTIFMTFRGKVWMFLAISFVSLLVLCCFKFVRQLETSSNNTTELPKFRREQKIDREAQRLRVNTAYINGIVIIFGIVNSIVQNSSLIKVDSWAYYFLMTACFFAAVAIMYPRIAIRCQWLSRLIKERDFALITFALLNLSGISSCVGKIKSTEMRYWMVPLSLVMTLLLCCVCYYVAYYACKEPQQSSKENSENEGCPECVSEAKFT